jgi:hypothetical protein
MQMRESAAFGQTLGVNQGDAFPTPSTSRGYQNHFVSPIDKPGTKTISFHPRQKRASGTKTFRFTPRQALGIQNIFVSSPYQQAWDQNQFVSPYQQARGPKLFRFTYQ